MSSSVPLVDSVLVIVGGMGPLAGIRCFEYVLENTLTNGTDQENLNTIVVSYPMRISNRVHYLFGEDSRNPGECVYDFLQAQLECLFLTYKKVVLGIPCITFHCPAIFSVFKCKIVSRFPNLEIVNIISSAVEFVHGIYPQLKRVGIMSTDGTRHAKPFEEEMKRNGFSLVYLNDKQQAIISDCIYNTEWGAKSQTFDKSRVYSLVCLVMDDLLKEGSEAILLGCTELPLAVTEATYRGIPVLNPSWIMARKMIQLVAPEKLKPLSY